jgi:hypothetical protein
MATPVVGIEAFHLRRAAGAGQLRFVEMADGRARVGGGRFAGEKSIAAVFLGPRLRRLHLEPSGRAAPAFFQACGVPVGINPKLPGPSVCVFSPICDGDAAFQNVEALFERVQVGLNGAAGIEKTDARAHVNRSHGAIHVRRAAETGAVLLVELGSLRGGWVDLGDSVHGVVDLLWLLLRYRRRRTGLAGSSLL